MVREEIVRCNSCILPKSSFFPFDDNGICSLCNAAKQNKITSRDTVKSIDKLNAHIKKIKEQGQGRPFDCVVGLSGGGDSSYLLYILVHQHHLRCLAVYYRTPFTSDVTDANVRRLTAKLNVPLVETNMSRDLHRRVARSLVLLWTKKPSTTLANMTCAPCKLVNREIYKTAKANDVKWVVYGGNIYESVQMASQVSHNLVLTSNAAAKRLSLKSQLQNTIRIIKNGIVALGTSVSLWRYIPIGFQASVMYINPHTPYLRFRYPGISVLEYFFFAGWDEIQCKKTLQELGWELPPGCRTVWKSDCSFAELKNCMFRKITGATYFDAFMSNMIRDGVLSRDKALRRVEIEGTLSPERISETFRILELPTNLLSLFKQEGE